MKIRFKKLSPSAVVPRKAHASDAGGWSARHVVTAQALRGRG